MRIMAVGRRPIRLAAQPPWMAGTSRISAAVASKARIGRVWPGPSSRKASRPGREVLGERRLGLGDRLGPVLIPLGQAEVAVARLQQSQLGHDPLTPFFGQLDRIPTPVPKARDSARHCNGSGEARLARDRQPEGRFLLVSRKERSSVPGHFRVGKSAIGNALPERHLNGRAAPRSSARRSRRHCPTPPGGRTRRDWPGSPMNGRSTQPI